MNYVLFVIFILYVYLFVLYAFPIKSAYSNRRSRYWSVDSSGATDTDATNDVIIPKKDGDGGIRQRRQTCDPNQIETPVLCDIDDPSSCKKLCLESRGYECVVLKEQLDNLPANVPICLRIQQADECNSATGEKLLVKVNDEIGYSYVCKCKYPHLVTQRSIFSDCNVDVACGPTNRLKSLQVDPLHYGECLCNDGATVSTRTLNGPACKPKQDEDVEDCYPGKPASRDGVGCECPDLYVDSSGKEAGGIFHANYLAQFTDKPRCLQRPCKFDVFTNNKLGDHTKLTETGCYCDPRWGFFGIKMNELYDYLKEDSRGYNACTELYSPEYRFIDTPVESICYFYFDKRPVCFLKFDNVRFEYVNPFLSGLLNNLRQGNTVLVEDEWPYNFFWYILEDRSRKFRFRIQRIMRAGEFGTLGGYSYSPTYLKTWTVYDSIPNCGKMRAAIPQHIRYNLYYYPVCFWTEKDAIFHGFPILNPYMMTEDQELDINPSVFFASKGEKFDRAMAVKLKFNKQDDVFDLDYIFFNSYEEFTKHRDKSKDNHPYIT